MPPSEFNPIKKPNHRWLWFVFVLVVIIGTIFGVMIILNTKEVPLLDAVKEKPVIYNTLPEGYKFIPAKAGEYPASFPKELVIFKDVQILRGEDTNDATGLNHKIVEYLVAESATNVTSQYQSKLLPLKWELSGKPITQGTLQILNFTKDKTALTIIISAKTATSSQVSLDLKI